MVHHPFFSNHHRLFTAVQHVARAVSKACFPAHARCHAGCDNGHNRTLQGWVEADTVFVSPDEQGRVEYLEVQEGDKVNKGELLFGLDDDLQQADVVVKQAAVSNAQQAFDRATQLLKSAAGTVCGILISRCRSTMA